MNVIWVGLGSGVGGIARYLLAAWIGRLAGGELPLGTLAVNVLGSFLIVVFVELASAGVLSPTARLALTTGVMGGFTTYSSFALKSLTLAQRGAFWLAAGNVLATVLT